MRSLNTVLLSGALAAEPELRYTPGGTAILKLRLAGVSLVGGREVFSNLSVKLLGKLAERHAELPLGAPLFAVGRLEYQSWQDAEGQKQSRLEVLCSELFGISGEVRQGNYGPLLHGAINRISLRANLTREVEERTLSGGTHLANLSLAWSEWDEKAKKEKSGFIRATLFGDAVREVADLKKGQPLLVGGRLKLESWESQGEKRYELRIADPTIVPLERISAQPTQTPSRVPDLDDGLIDTDDFPPEDTLPF